jgi:hypothetical protein
LKIITVNGVEAVALLDISKATGLSVDTLRRRQSRGRLVMEPVASIGGTHLYRASEVRRIFADSLVCERDAL